MREEDKKEKVADEQPEYYNALQYLANYYLRKDQLDDACTYAYKCIECEEVQYALGIFSFVMRRKNHCFEIRHSKSISVSVLCRSRAKLLIS